MKILADQQIPFAQHAFQEFGDVELIHGREITRDCLDDVEILLVRSITKVNRELLEGSAVKFVGTATSGFDHIDQDYLQSQNIEFAYAPGSNARSVAEYIISALMVLFAQDLEQLQNSTVGIIGYGHVGSKVARFLEALGMECLINDPPLERQQPSPLFVPLEEVLKANIISLHVPLIKDGLYPTQYLIGAPELEKINHDAVLINTARGGVIDENALLKKMQHSALRTIIDVWENEPNISEELLKQADITSSHIAGYSTDGKLRATEMLFHQACEFFKHSPNWNAEDFYPEKTNKILFENPSMQSIEAVKTLVDATYNIMDDHQLLQAALALEINERAGYFDTLRKQYRERFEFMHTQYAMPEQLNIDVTLLEKLGFNRVVNS